ncbi:TetR/AcrR family transcriptional regulator [Glycomyces algeriensis]|uniref:TetR family transcriptional regulator n=1 Tax=Glycomyces algeriensis TaxID=256037 RepID=A0A9W6G4W5_9ACTN|nr:TetR/AcrR family transcriptional regulator [Glycomyces algeriensis]MDA1367207.1 TetR/AcrR family transcriptional regulator [Glycomyces algeriensis]MDR7353409.1 AcrR family transcriptional regulator [Glycomyces algeriensis]GLI41105.1 TetR family transcriptional regulator [Glycomyces algeriensis]
MPAQRTPDPNRRNPESTKAILEAALTLARDQGWSKVSIEGIAAQAGVGKRTIYRWWPSKGAVVLDAYAARLQDRPYMSAGEAQDGELREDLVRVLGETWDMVSDSLPLLASLIGEAQHDPDLGERLWERLIGPSSLPVQARIERAQANGEIAGGADPFRAAELIYGQIYLRLLVTPKPIDAAFLENCVDLALHGLRSRA